jgi:peptide/nickel transport system substrate-binding protein
MNIRQLATAAIACALVTLIACGGGEKKNGGARGGADRLVIGLKSSPTNLDPRVGQDNASGRIFDLCCRGLVRVTPEMDYAPDVATGWETPDDRTVIFKLNPNAKFQDADPSPRRT